MKLSILLFALLSAFVCSAETLKIHELNFECGDFILNVKLKTENGGKARLRFHTDDSQNKGYSVIIDNDKQSRSWWKSTGSLESVRNIANKFVSDGQWFDLAVKVHGTEISVYVDGMQVVEYVEPKKPFRTEKNREMKLSKGKISFEILCGEVESKDWRVKKLPPRCDIDNQQFAAIDETKDAVVKLHQNDIPVMDYHVHLKGGLTSDWAFAKSRKTGINYGVAPNCGKDFELNEQRKAEDFLRHTGKNYPFILCMQAEGREWHKLFGKETRKQFAYVFTDAMTFDDRNGKRTHIWRDNEVDCPEGKEEAYMDLIVETICEVLENEPADIYANPMRLPNVLRKNEKKYWTHERRKRVLESLVKSGKALEINMLSRLPDCDFIKAAKSRGVKFTFGSNNAVPDFGRFEYAAEIIEKCELTADDFFNPYSAKISKR